jgi:hypothetical protein
MEEEIGGDVDKCSLELDSEQKPRRQQEVVEKLVKRTRSRRSHFRRNLF